MRTSFKLLLSKNTGAWEKPSGKRERDRETEREENVVYFGLCESSVHFYRREDHINAVYAK